MSVKLFVLEILIIVVGVHVERRAHVVEHLIFVLDAVVFRADLSTIKKGDTWAARNKHCFNGWEVRGLIFKAAQIESNYPPVNAKEIATAAKSLHFICGCLIFGRHESGKFYISALVHGI